MTECNKISMNSFLSMGATDGPGVRSVVFFQGCKLRCDYCHNPETWEFKTAQTDIDEIVSKVLRYKPYYKDNGGVTISGGEPLGQQNELTALLKKLKANNIHTAVDTSVAMPVQSDFLDYTDMILLDVKFLSNEEYKKHTGLEIFDNVIDLLEKTQKMKIPVWIRHVLYPNITDNEQYVTKLKEFLSKYNNIERIDLLPFKNICISKYENLGLDFKMKDTKLTPIEQVQKLKKMVK